MQWQVRGVPGHRLITGRGHLENRGGDQGDEAANRGTPWAPGSWQEAGRPPAEAGRTLLRGPGGSMTATPEVPGIP